MVGRRLGLGTALALAALGLCACTSRDERAATAAGIAADAFGNGDIATARAQIATALAQRDDVSDYWMLSAQIAIAAHDFAGAFTAYESALTLDRTNIEALTRLCQLAASIDMPQRAEQYAGQLLALQPGNRAALNLQAALAMKRGDKAGAAAMLDALLKDDPTDAIALVTRARLLLDAGDYAAAAKAVEASLATPGDPVGRLEVARQIYLQGNDAAGYRRTIERLAKATPRAVPAQLAWARGLYDAGDRARGFAVTRRILALAPGDVATTDAVLQLWRAQGAAAMPADAIAPAAAGGVPETRAAFAAYANALGKPDIAMAALGDAGGAAAPSTATNDAIVARAQAQVLLGQRAAAAAGVDAVLAADPDQPRALALRGSLRGGTDRRGAIEDLRHALAGDPGFADARLALADLQIADGDTVLAIETLRDGLGSQGADPRLVTRLMRVLRGQGRGAEAAGALADYIRLNPFAPHPPG